MRAIQMLRRYNEYCFNCEYADSYGKCTRTACVKDYTTSNHTTPKIDNPHDTSLFTKLPVNESTMYAQGLRVEDLMVEIEKLKAINEEKDKYIESLEKIIKQKLEKI